ncbi:hypothetical protein ACFLWC_01955 [Chloroflexota bacterium]
MTLDYLWLINSSPVARKQIIEQAANSVSVPDGIDNNLSYSYKVSRIIQPVIKDYIKEMVRMDDNDSILEQGKINDAIKSEINFFLPHAIGQLRESIPSIEELQQRSNNLYEIAGARRLAFANKATRTLSTTMGSLWEKIANISPYALNPESEFGIKIKGIDVILMNKTTEDIEFAQLKTQQSTLTGSQKPRSVQELQIHENPIFCACFDTNSSWTFNHETIPRLKGAEFWDRIGIQYGIVLDNVKRMILDLETEYRNILNQI